MQCQNKFPNDSLNEPQRRLLSEQKSAEAENRQSFKIKSEVDDFSEFLVNLIRIIRQANPIRIN